MLRNTAYRIAAAVCLSRVHGYLPRRAQSLMEVAYFRGPHDLNMRQRVGLWLLCRRNMPRPLLALAFWLVAD